jgi:chromatin remodeling complex protein RSC6
MSKASKQTKVEAPSKASEQVVESNVVAPKKNKKTEEAVVAPAVTTSKKSAVQAPVVSAEASAPAPAKKPRVSKKATEAVAEEVVAESSSSEVSEKKGRRQVSRESVETSFDELLQSVESEIEVNREDKKRGTGVKFLRTVAKNLKQLKADFQRVASGKKVKAKSERPANSGFMKCVPVSAEMRKFAGVKDDQLVSRVDVTKSICKYVKEHNLQNKEDRRQFTPDEKLAKLLGTGASTTYYNLQKVIQPHFIRDAPAVASK